MDPAPNLRLRLRHVDRVTALLVFAVWLSALALIALDSVFAA